MIFGEFYFSSPNTPKLDSLHIPENYCNLLGKLNIDLEQDEIHSVQNQEPIYSMRILKPSANYPIQIYQPDSTKSYSLLIKKFLLENRS